MSVLLIAYLEPFTSFVFLELFDVFVRSSSHDEELSIKN